MEIFVRYLTGKTITISTTDSDTIRSLHRQIEAKVGTVAWGGLRLVFGGKQLNADLKLSDYKILPSSTIDIVIRFPGGGGSRWRPQPHPLPPVVSVFTRNFETGEQQEVSVSANRMDTVKELKKRVLDNHSELAGALRQGELFYGGVVLEDEHTLGYYDIDGGAILYLGPVFTHEIESPTEYVECKWM